MIALLRQGLLLIRDRKPAIWWLGSTLNAAVQNKEMPQTSTPHPTRHRDKAEDTVGRNSPRSNPGLGWRFLGPSMHSYKGILYRISWLIIRKRARCTASIHRFHAFVHLLIHSFSHGRIKGGFTGPNNCINVIKA